MRHIRSASPLLNRALHRTRARECTGARARSHTERLWLTSVVVLSGGRRSQPIKFVCGKPSPDTHSMTHPFIECRSHQSLPARQASVDKQAQCPRPAPPLIPAHSRPPSLPFHTAANMDALAKMTRHQRCSLFIAALLAFGMAIAPGPSPKDNAAALQHVCRSRAAGPAGAAPSSLPTTTANIVSLPTAELDRHPRAHQRAAGDLPPLWLPHPPRRHPPRGRRSPQRAPPRSHAALAPVSSGVRD